MQQARLPFPRRETKQNDDDSARKVRGLWRSWGTVVGENDLSEIFAQRPRLNARITELIDAATGPWGIEVSQAPDLVLLVLSFLVFDEFMTFLYQ